MIDIFMPIQSFLKFDKVHIDNAVFRLHYRMTVILLLVFCLLVTSKQFFGEPMNCFGDDLKQISAINSYCWIYGTYTLTNSLNARSAVYPGVGPKNGKNDEEVWHSYYQWVCFLLLGQAAMFYTPRYLWKMWEGGRLKALTADLVSPIVPKSWSESRRRELLLYLGHCNMYSHNLYAMRYAFCELLNLANVIGQIYILDVFLGGSFRNYGSAVAAVQRLNAPTLPSDQPVHPMDKYFPKITKCLFRMVGPSGDAVLRDWICVLPLNIVNEKIFVVLWFWLIILSFLSAISFLFRIIVFSLPPLRTMLIMGQVRFVKRRVVSKIVRRFNFGDWFVLYLLGKNMNACLFKELILELSKQIDNKTVSV